MKLAKNIYSPDTSPLKTAILVLDDCNTLSFAAAVDPMRAANRRAGKPLFNWEFYTALGAPAHLTSGLRVEGAPIADLVQCDLLIIVAGFRLKDHATPRLLSSLKRLARFGTPMAAIDGGPYLLASAGLLDGHQATTHWEDLDEFASQFPNIQTRRDRFCISGPFATSGGAAPCIDMMLHLIDARYGSDLAQSVGGAFLYDPMPAGQQSPRSTPRPVRHQPQIARALELMETTLDDPLPLARIAAHAGVSLRTLELRFRAHLGRSPKAHYLSLRLAEAHRLAADTLQPVHDIALATGFASPSSFSRAFRAAFGTTARAVRQAQSARK
ncbi:GlxA family transcriptional regulator [Shimia sp.]|uniref:GlxA family transcriptional regulator n=1 Tax=Shimia sp. TaxID=1954381 RepID=UPI003297B11B